jgi:hypothetical protein
MSGLTRSEEEDEWVSIIPAPYVQMTLAGKGGGRRGQDCVEVVPALVRYAARGWVVHLVQELQTLQPVGPQGVGSGPSGLSAYVAAAVARQIERDNLNELIAVAEAEHGPVTDEEVQALR